MPQDDGLTPGDMAALLDSFPGQPLDFYGALRSATYDGQIRAWIRDEVVGGDIAAEDSNMRELSRRLINRCDTNPWDWSLILLTDAVFDLATDAILFSHDIAVVLQRLPW